jgi:predicted acylesterase/phospholipase RssA
VTDWRRRPEGGGRPRRRRAHHGVAAALALLVHLPRAGLRSVRAALPRDAPTALVLSGGGAKGAWEAGVAGAPRRGDLPVPDHRTVWA